MHNFTRLPPLSLGAALLCGCSGAPSESQMNDALLSQIKQEQAAIEHMMGKGAADMARRMSPEITGLHKIGCKTDGENAYRCDVEIEAKQGANVSKNTASLRFVKTSNGWGVSK